VFFHDIAKPECFRVVNGYTNFKGHAQKSAIIAEQTMRRLRYDNAAINKVRLLIAAHDDDIYANDVSVKKALSKYGLETLLELCEVQIADEKSKAGFVEIKVDNHVQVMVKACEIVQSGECYSLPQLAVNGDDLIKLGYKGEEIGRILQELLNKVITGEAINEKEALLNVISGYRN
jgi:tRNA nucleotidyltransferase (CCA-adding enzyme)